MNNEMSQAFQSKEPTLNGVWHRQHFLMVSCISDFIEMLWCQYQTKISCQLCVPLILLTKSGTKSASLSPPPPLPPSANLKMFDFPAIPSLDWLIGRAATAMGLGLGKVVVESWHFLQESEVAYLVTQYDISNCPGPLAKAALYTISTHLTYLPEYLPGVSELTTCNFYHL